MISADPREDARHRRAHALAEQAAVLAHVGDLARARDVYGQAGDLAAAVARACPLGVDSLGPFIAARAVTLWCNAGRFADARDLALTYLRGADLDPFARLRLQASLDSLNCDFPVVAPEVDLWTFPIDAPCEDPAAIGPFLGLGGVVHPVQRALLDAGDPRGRHLHGEHDHLREDLGRIE